ncbi:MAG: glycosyltransferase [Magnetococcales bacterium]|nr:glycosyltransferase [Magnetococcales bacterium]MBF0321938.1 glycosyltransferase [Magnetococcales bacterium]
MCTRKRKERLLEIKNNLAGSRDWYTRRNLFFHEQDWKYLRHLIPEGVRVLELGSNLGDRLVRLKPSCGVGVELSPRMVELARAKYPHLEFIVGDIEQKESLARVQGSFDFIILGDTLGELEDCQATLDQLHPFCTRDTRLVVTYYSWIWAPILKLAGWLGMRIPDVEHNWMSTQDIQNLLALASFETVKNEWRLLFPIKSFGLGPLINRYIGTLPLIQGLCLRSYVVARSLKSATPRELTTTILIPCRNEKGNIAAAITRMPRFCQDLELIFIEGNSQDGTFEECVRVKEANPLWDIKVFKQPGRGKGDAVRKGLQESRGEVVMILDADLTVPPEELPKFHQALASGMGEYINGTRMIYPMSDQAMRFLNFLANRTFSYIFSWLLNQRYTDTLCGVKVLTRKHFLQIVSMRDFFGNLDPFGDFDMIFGSNKLNLKMLEIPVHYAARSYGKTQISRFRDGFLLLRMVIVAYRKLKSI